jgi:hypothetical protein
MNANGGDYDLISSVRISGKEIYTYSEGEG